MRSAVLAITLLLSLLFYSADESWAQECSEETLKTNIDNGRHLLTTSGNLYDVLSGDNIDAMLWLPMSSLQVCGPKNFAYKGKAYQIYKIVNTDDGESVDAFRVGKKGSTSSQSSSCYSSYIRKPTPFNGNGGELIVLADGSMWEENSYQYLYLYEYNPQVTICPDKGLMIIGSHTFRVSRFK